MQNISSNYSISFHGFSIAWTHSTSPLHISLASQQPWKIDDDYDKKDNINILIAILTIAIIHGSSFSACSVQFILFIFILTMSTLPIFPMWGLKAAYKK